MTVTNRTAELHSIRDGVSDLIVRTLNLHNVSGSSETDDLLDQLETMYAQVEDLIAA